MPRVSIITALFNNEAHSAVTILPTRRSSNLTREMIVVDNGSTDRGASIARQFADPHIRVIECFKRGPGAARKAGPRHADSDGVLFLDADDLIEPEHLASLLDIGARSGAEIVA